MTRANRAQVGLAVLLLLLVSARGSAQSVAGSIAVTSTLSLAEDVVGDATRWLANTAAGTEARSG